MSGVGPSLAPTPVNPSARVVLLGKPGCHLCDLARATVSSVCQRLGVIWEEQSLEDDQALRERYRDEIPVTFVDGRVLSIWRVNSSRLVDALGG